DHCDPAPVTSTMPDEPPFAEIEAKLLVNVPPLWTVTLPVPLSPMITPPDVVHCDPLPDTRTLPLEPARRPSVKDRSDTWPPFVTLAVPVMPAPKPTVTLPELVKVPPLTVSTPPFWETPIAVLPFAPLTASVFPLVIFTLPLFANRLGVRVSVPTGVIVPP